WECPAFLTSDCDRATPRSRANDAGATSGQRVRHVMSPNRAGTLLGFPSGVAGEKGEGSMLPPGPAAPRRSEIVLTVVIAALAIPVHIAGLMVPTLYRDPAILVPQNLGTDLVTVALMIPLFGFSCAVMGRWPRFRLLW